MKTAYESASVADVFMFVRDNHTAWDADVLESLLRIYTIFAEEPEWHLRSMELHNAPQRNTPQHTVGDKDWITRAGKSSFGIL